VLAGICAVLIVAFEILTGVEILVPIDPSTLSAKYYQPDELHLNSDGAALFTSALATFLPQRVLRQSVASAD